MTVELSGDDYIKFVQRKDLTFHRVTVGPTNSQYTVHYKPNNSATAEPAEREIQGHTPAGDISTDKPFDLSAPLPTSAVAPVPVQPPAWAIPEPERSLDDMFANIQERARINRRNYAISKRRPEARLPHAD